MLNNGIEGLDLVGLLGTCLGVINYQLNQQQSTNDDILKEIKYKQEKYLEEILSNQEKILNLLSTK